MIAHLNTSVATVIDRHFNLIETITQPCAGGASN